MVMKSGSMSAQQLLLALGEFASTGPIEARVLGDGQRVERLPREGRTELRVERE